MIQLGINIDHVATLRQARGTRYPDPIEAAFRAQKGGADGITVHLREDRRHIQERDVLMLLDTIEVPLNLEMGATKAMIDFACAHPAAECCLVPEKREELTTEGGLDAAGQVDRLSEAVAALSGVGSRVSLFLDPDPRQLEAAVAIGAPVVELHTGRYADAVTPAEQAKEYEALYRAAEEAMRLGLTLHAGHGLTHHNVAAICRLPGIAMLNIGHAIIARAVMTGMEESVASMKRIMIEAKRGGA